MNKLHLLTMTLIILSTTAFSQQLKSCCQAPSSTVAFASFADQATFTGAHESPLPLSYVAQGKMITYPTPDGKTGSAYFIPASGKSNKFLFVFQEWWGLNDYIKRQADSYADSLKDVNILAIDLYDGKVTTNPEEAGKLMQSVNDTRLRNIITGAFTYAGKDARVGTVGWCFGGGWSMQAALMGGKQTKACIMYYGMPETDVAKLKNLNSDVIFMFAKKDQWINEEVKDAFVKNMQSAGKKLTVKEYDADHAFANPSNPHFNKEFAASAHQVAISYLKSSLK